LLPVDALSVVLRALGFLALFQAAGTAIFLAFFGGELTASTQVIRRIGVLAGWIASALVVGHYALEPARMAGELAGMMDPTYVGMVTESSLSVVLALRVVGLALILIGLRGAQASKIETAAKTPGLLGARSSKVALVPKAPGLLGALLIAASFVFMGHTTTHAHRWLLDAMLLTHLLVVAFWFGALLPLYRVSAQEAADVAGRIVEAFSRRAIWLVPALFIAGLVLAISIVPTLAALLTTYGRLLLTKIAGFALLMVLATLNKWRYGPALARNDMAAGTAFRRSVLAEYAIIAAVLCVTAVMTTFYSPDE
jgi:putative copper resistance protein D